MKSKDSEDPLRIETILKKAKKKAIPVEKIEDDESLSVRTQVDPAFTASDLVVESGIVDLSDGHAVVVQKAGSMYRLVSGFRRITAVRACEGLQRIRCLVLREESPLQATIVSCRYNATHGEPLSCKDRREAFYREYDLRESKGCQVSSLREYARAYRVSQSTPQNWLDQRSAKQAADTSETVDDASADVQVGQAAEPDMPPAEPDDGVSVDCETNSPADSTGGISSLKLASSEKPALEGPTADEIITEFEAAVFTLRSGISTAHLGSEHVDRLRKILKNIEQDLQLQTA